MVMVLHVELMIPPRNITIIRNQARLVYFMLTIIYEKMKSQEVGAGLELIQVETTQQMV
jgi:hypothetical protein